MSNCWYATGGTVTALWLFLASAACQSLQRESELPSPTSAASAEDHHVRYDSHRITRAEIGQLGQVLSAYDVVIMLRRQWIVGRAMPETPRVYIEDLRYGKGESLKQIDANTVNELRFLDPADATIRFGPGHTAGAILVTLLRR